MKPKYLFPLAILLFVSLACNIGTATPAPATDTPKSVVTEAAATEEVKPVETEATEAPTEAASTGGVGLVKDLDAAEKGVIRIVAAGGFELPSFGDFQQNWSGSGFIIDPSGLAVTNNHVVTGAATIKVYFYGDSKPHSARILGASECSDLALIDLDGEDYPYFDWYTSDAKLGMEVYSLGYPLGDPEISRHKGSVSKRAADVSTNWTSVNSVLEHDAIINPGNSGGPLVSSAGQVLGINYAGSNDYNQYYAITYKEAKPILETLKQGKNFMWIGINGEAFVSKDGTLTGIFVYSVASGSPADKAGIKSGDVITKMEGILLAPDGTMKEYCDVLRSKGDDATLTVRVYRYESDQYLEGQINGRALAVVGGNAQGGNQNGGQDNTQGNNQGADQGTTDSQAYYTEEFKEVPKNWTWDLVTSGSDKLINVYVKDDRLKFDLRDKAADSYVYLKYDPYIYDNVIISTEYENFGNTNNGVALFCRQTEDGWYEFRMSSGGVYDIFRYDPSLRGQNPYVRIGGGGTPKLRAGIKKINTLAFSCAGQTLSAYVNDTLIWEDEDRILRNQGYAGIAAMSYRQVPVQVEFEWAAISAPN